MQQGLKPLDEPRGGGNTHTHTRTHTHTTTTTHNTTQHTDTCSLLPAVAAPCSPQPSPLTKVRCSTPLAGRPDTESWLARPRADGVGLSDVLNLGRRPTPWRVVPSMMPSPGEYNEGIVSGLDFFLHSLGRRNMTCVLMLSNMWPWSGGFAQYVSWGKHAEAHQPWTRLLPRAP